MKPSPPTLTVISLGRYVQSSVIALTASEGAFDRMPDCAIFAYNRWEPPRTSSHLECPWSLQQPQKTRNLSERHCVGRIGSVR